MIHNIPFDAQSRRETISLVRYYFFLWAIGSPYLGFARAQLIDNSSNPVIVSLSSDEEEKLTSSMLSIKKEAPFSYKVLKARYAHKENSSYKDIAFQMKISQKRTIYLHDKGIKLLFKKMMMSSDE